MDRLLIFFNHYQNRYLQTSSQFHPLQLSLAFCPSPSIWNLSTCSYHAKGPKTALLHLLALKMY
uniref:Uncharacterized protein MANES_13G059900 n=1 Tax=Rhizophora mucronata TaxID=61149 RepID=A0A2P2M4B5_RHIMU